MKETSCRRCRWLAVAPDSDGKVRPRAGRAYRCRIEVPKVPLPRSVRTVKYDKRYMEPDEGQNCFYFEDRKK